MRFIDRRDAGKQLAQALLHLKGRGVVVLALPRGGIVPAAEVARTLKVPLGIVFVRKIGHPLSPEYAIGAIAEGGKPIYNQQVAALIAKRWLKQTEQSARNLIMRRQKLYYGAKAKPPDTKDKIVILVDDGIATGLTMQAAVQATRAQGARKIIVAVPVAPVDSVSDLEKIAEEVIVLDHPENFLGAVGSHYTEFDQVDDAEVAAILDSFSS